MTNGGLLPRIARFVGANAVTISMIALGGVFIIAARSLPPPRFDPLGAAPFPIALGWLIIVLGGLDLVTKARITGPEDLPKMAAATMLRAAAVLALTIAYGLSMAVLDIRFAIATTLYLMAASFVVGASGPARLVALSALFAAFALGLDHILKAVVYVDLP